MATAFPLAVVLTAVDRLSGPLGKAGGRVNRFGRSATNAGKALSFGLTAPIALLGITTTRTAVAFESSMLNVKALTKATGPEFDALNEKARSLGSSTQFSASEAADAMGFLAQAGFDTNEVLETTPEILKLAAAANMDLAETADLASNILTGYGKKASELADQNNILTATFTGSNTNLQQLAEAMKIAGPIAHGMGFKMEQTAALIGKMGDAGFQGTLAGTALRGALAKLSRPAGDAVRIFGRLKINKDDILDGAGNVKDLSGVLDLLSTSGATTADMLGIFGQRAGPAMVALMGQGGKAIREFQAEIEGAGDITERVATTKMSGLQGTLLVLKSAFQELQLTIAESGLIEWVGSMATKLTGFIKRIAETDPKMLRMGLVIAGVAAAAGPALLIVGQLALGFGALMQGATLLIPVLKMIGVTLFRSVIPAVWSFTVALLANPIGAIVGGVIALVAAGIFLVKNWDRVSAFFVGSWQFIQSKVGAVIVWLLDKIESFLSVLPDWAVDLLKGGTPLGALFDRKDAIGERAVDQARLSAANFDTAFGAGGAGGDAHVTVDLNGLPEGATVDADPTGSADLELNVGFAMAGGL